MVSDVLVGTLQCDAQPALATGFLLALLALTDPILALSGAGVAWILRQANDAAKQD